MALRMCHVPLFILWCGHSDVALLVVSCNECIQCQNFLSKKGTDLSRMRKNGLPQYNSKGEDVSAAACLPKDQHLRRYIGECPSQALRSNPKLPFFNIFNQPAHMEPHIKLPPALGFLFKNNQLKSRTTSITFK
jgi:hypothetical protein